MQTLTVALAERSYPILIGQGILHDAASLVAPYLRAPRVVIVTDAHVGALYADKLMAECSSHGIKVDKITLPAGESTKSFAHFSTLLEQLLALTPDRKMCLIALGGGVIGDITGFAASVLLRGVDFIQIPTSLLAQVDSSVGGKTGINTPQGKNLVGTFYQPKLVLIDTDTFDTLPARQRRAGYAEMIKYGLLGDGEFAAWLMRHGEKILDGEKELLARAIYRSCEMKAAIVARDERESDARALLNLGHTLAHALEAETGFGDILLHGEAVAIGMVFAAQLSHALGLIGADVADSLRTHLQHIGLPALPQHIRKDWDAQALMAHMKSDKKAEDGALTFVLMRAVGEAFVQKSVESAMVHSVLTSFVEQT